MEISVTARDAAKVPTLSFTSEDLIVPTAFHIFHIWTSLLFSIIRLIFEFASVFVKLNKKYQQIVRYYTLGINDILL